MKLVTDQWVRRDGKPLIAVYQKEDGELLSVTENEFETHLSNGRWWSAYEKPEDLLPVPREPTYRPFRDLREAFEVMGPTPWMRDKGKGHWWTANSWNTLNNTINGHSMETLFDLAEWTNNPSDTAGKTCGVEVKQ